MHFSRLQLLKRMKRMLHETEAVRRTIGMVTRMMDAIGVEDAVIVSEEEQKYLDGQGDIERQLYVKEKIEEIDRELLLKRGQHYVEIMYVAQGSITHCIEGKELVLHKGDVFQAI